MTGNHDLLLIRHHPQTRCRMRSGRAGLTLVEMMVVVAVTLIFMIALTQVFSMLGDGIMSGRALIELNGQKRAVTSRLQSDLDSITVPVIPWQTLQNGGGYLEIVEGSATDKDVNADDIIDPGAPPFDNRFGDTDDVVMFTARSYDVPFVGNFVINDGSIIPIESNLAEIIWWTQFTPAFDDLNRNGIHDFGETTTLYRRVLLISPTLTMPSLNGNTTKPDLTQAALTSRYEFITGVKDPTTGNVTIAGSDISVRFQDGQLVMNTLADLTKRENRVARNPSQFPHAFDPTLLDLRRGDDVVLTNVLAFDIRVYDPKAPLFVVNDHVLSPSDPGWTPGGWNSPNVPRGAYVDLNYGQNTDFSDFSGPPHSKSQLVIAGQRGTYCTWSFHYEHDGLNQYDDPKNTTPLIDEGTDGQNTFADQVNNNNPDNRQPDGVDDNGAVDDSGERETSPPYPAPLRGMQIRLRVYEPDSKTVRQSTVTTTFSQ